MEEKTEEQKFKETILDMNRGYPGYIYYPKNFEEKFGKDYLKVIAILKNDKVIVEGINLEGDLGYRLSGSGMDIANSIITGLFTKETHYFTKLLLWITKLLLTIGGLTLVVGLLQYLKIS